MGEKHYYIITYNSTFLENVKTTQSNDLGMWEMWDRISKGVAKDGWTYDNGELHFHRKIMVPDNDYFR